MSNLDTQYRFIELDLIEEKKNDTLFFNLSDVDTSDFFIKITKNKENISLANYKVVLYVIKPSSVVRDVILTYDSDLKAYYCDLSSELKNIAGTYTAQCMVIDETTGEKKGTRSQFKYQIESDILSKGNQVVSETVASDILNRIIALEQGATGGLGASINDNVTSTTSTWSSNKISSQLQQIVAGTGGATIVSRDNGYNYEYVGTIFPAQDVYQSWPIAGVQYDEELDKIMCLVSDADGHSSATKMKLTLYSVNPQTSEIAEIKVVREGLIDTPTTNIHDAFRSQRGFLIDNDTGIYYKFHFGDDKVPKACKSIDKGVNWIDIPITETNNASILFAGGNGQIIKTSSGRIICGLFGNGFAYTDDFFEHLTYVTSGRVAEQGASRVHEYEIIELEENKLVAICRYSWNPTATGNWSNNQNSYRDEKAWITYSTDNGENWTYPVTTDMRMTATNCCSFVEGDFINFYVGTRFFADGITTFKNGMYYLKISKEDLLNNNLSNGELMFYGNSQQYSDFGNLACCTDCRGNLHLFYNDGKEQNTCRWHYIKASKTTVNNSKIVENPTLKEVQSYNAKAVDSLIASIYTYISSVKGELLLKIGELPESGTVDNPTFWTTGGLASYCTFKEEDWDAEISGFKPKFGNYDYQFLSYSSPYGGGGSLSTSYSRSILGSKNIGLLLKDLIINSTEGFTIEVDIEGYDGTSNTNRLEFFIGNNSNNNLIVSPYVNFSYSYEYYLSEYNTTAFEQNMSTRKTVYPNGVFDITRKINTISWVFDRINNKSQIAFNGLVKKEFAQTECTEGYSWDLKNIYQASEKINHMKMSSNAKRTCIRFYNKALTSDELLLNANYSNL